MDLPDTSHSEQTWAGSVMKANDPAEPLVGGTPTEVPQDSIEVVGEGRAGPVSSHPGESGGGSRAIVPAAATVHPSGTRRSWSAIDALQERLGALPPGPVDKGALLPVLEVAWDDLDGGDGHAMHAGKLHRLEDPRWQPPVLYFDIERHGATVNGSTYVEVQSWAVDVQSGLAEVICTTRRKLHASAPRMDMKAIASEVAEIIRTGADDPRVKHQADGSVMVLTRELLPPSVKQTMEGRRRKFYVSLDAELSPQYVRSQFTYRQCGDSERALALTTTCED